ncbi:N-6 DNA methylase [Kitasatospora sp. NPDC090308]|uniref:N-6 DNA methylase n=1 Tax=Kitasatospora sp. NPDC090308 TaxID=3364082 RepID=UPI0038265200
MLNSLSDDSLLRRSRIAALAGVSRPTVTAWGKQYRDFPSPRRSGGQEYFRLSDILDWLDGRTVPSNRLVGGEPVGTTYGDRVRRNHTAGGEGPTGLGAERPGAGPAPGTAAAGPDDERIVKELMGSLVDRVRGAAGVVDYLNLLFALQYLRGSDDSQWAALRKDSREATGLEAVARLLHHIGAVTDENLRRFGVSSDMTEALSRLEPRTARDLREVIERVARLRGNVFELILCEYEERAALGSREFFTPRGVVQLMAGLACSGHEPGEMWSVYDPYARSGELLAQAAASLTAEDAHGSPTALQIRGETRRADTWRLASMNLALHGVRPELELRRTVPWDGRSRRGTPGSADIVLTNPPFNMNDPARKERQGGEWAYGAPPLDNDNFAYVQHCLSMLRAGGRAGIIMPTKAGNSGHRAELEIRRNLIERGVIEGVITLPPHLFSGTPVPVSIWILRHPDDPCDHVLFLDGRHLGTKNGPRRTLSDQDVEAILDAYGGARAGGETNGHCTTSSAREVEGKPVSRAWVSRDALRAQGYSLHPLDHIRHHESVTGEAVAAFSAARQQMAELEWQVLRAQNATAGFPHLSTAAPSAPSCPVPVVPLDHLCEIKAGPSYSRLGKTQRAATDGSVPVVYPRHLKDGRIANSRDELVDAKTADLLAGFSLRVDDIVCVRSGAIGTPSLVRASQEGWLMSPNIIRLRLRKQAEVLPEYLLYHLSREKSVGWMRDRAASTAAPSIRTGSLGRLEVPLPPLSEQHTIVSALVHLDELDRLYREFATSARGTRSALADLLMNFPPQLGLDAPTTRTRTDEEDPL